MNPEVDIIFRGRGTCLQGDAFRIRCRNWARDEAPIAATKTLAVDWTAIRHNDESGLLGVMDRLAECAKRGVLRIFIVIGHDDGASEANFVMQKHGPELGNFSHGTGSAGQELAEFIPSVMDHWRKTVDGYLTGIPVPQISFRTVERAPVEVFPHFQKLPAEIQDLIWKFAVPHPRVITLGRTRGTVLFLLSHCTGNPHLPVSVVPLEALRSFESTR